MAEQLRRALLLASILLVASASHGEPAERRRIAVVVSTNWDVGQITRHDLRQIYLGQTKEVSGVDVVPVDGRAGTQIYTAFLETVFRMSKRSFEDYWLEQALSGGARPPRQIGDDSQRLEFIARTVGALGYVDAESVAGTGHGVRVVPVDGQKPSDPDYPLTY